MRNDMLAADKRTLMVFSHPNHELAIYGLMNRLLPYTVFLTDGGSSDRLEQTRKGLDSIGILNRATFLNWREDSFYHALLRQDGAFYEGIADTLASHVRSIDAEQVICDAVEFYNPVHDMALPIVHAALRGSENMPVFEAPLIYQRRGPELAFTLQRPSGSHPDESVHITLSAEEFQTKLLARSEIYTTLSNHLARLLATIPKEHWKIECVTKARESVPRPTDDMLLRYDQRAEMLAQRGQIKEKILYHQHYVPLASTLFNSVETSHGIR
jgi:hypothetical protein